MLLRLVHHAKEPGTGAPPPPLLELAEGLTVLGRAASSGASEGSNVRLTASDSLGQQIISRRHASLEWRGEHVVLLDLGALNGVAVNGVRVGRAELVPGDVLQLGGASHVPVGAKLLRDETCLKFELARKISVSSDRGSVIQSSALRTHLECSLCSQVLIDAVVLACSHCFCRCCIETHWRRPAPPPAPRASACPCCEEGDGSMPALRAYVRCCVIDNVIWLLTETLSPAERQVFDEREARARRTLLGMGIDPDTLSGENKISESQGSERIVKKRRSSDDLDAVLCLYCGQLGHTERACPSDPLGDDGSVDTHEEQ